MSEAKQNYQQFGGNPNYLALLVIAGLKTTTCSAKICYELEQEPLPEVNSHSIYTDFCQQPLVEVRIKEVMIQPFGQVSVDFALSEGVKSYHDWQQIHRQFFNHELQRIYAVAEKLIYQGDYLTITGWRTPDLVVETEHSHNYRHFPENAPSLGIKQRQITDQFELVCEWFEVVKIFPQSYQQWLTFAIDLLQENIHSDPYLNPKLDANLLLQAVTKRSKSAIFAFPETLLTEKELRQLAQWLVRRLNGEPMAYILGEKEFWSLPLQVSPATLIPRPDTERLVEVALELINKRSNLDKILRIADLGTGTGAIALALASELGHQAEIIGIDVQPEAVQLAESNRQRLGLDNVSFMQSDWFSALKNQQFDLIVSNPPYIDCDDENLAIGDVRFEPLTALVAAQQGLADLQKIIENAPLYLKANGVLILEHGWQQAQAVQSLFQQYQWDNPQTAQDYGGNDRITWAIWTK